MEKLQGRTVNALASSAEEGRGTLRKAPGRCVQPFEPEMSEWGNPRGGMPTYSVLNKIGTTEGTGGSETSKYPEEKRSFR